MQSLAFLFCRFQYAFFLLYSECFNYIVCSDSFLILNVWSSKCPLFLYGQFFSRFGKFSDMIFLIFFQCSYRVTILILCLWLADLVFSNPQRSVSACSIYSLLLCYHCHCLRFPIHPPCLQTLFVILSVWKAFHRLFYLSYWTLISFIVEIFGLAISLFNFIFIPSIEFLT